MLYFPILWILSILFYVFFFILLSKAEKKHNVYFERHPGNSFPILKPIKTEIKTSTEPNKARDFKLVLLSLYLSYFLFIAPVLIYFISALIK